MNTDDDAVARAKRGDGEAWRALYCAHAGRLVVWLSTRPCGDDAVAPDDLAAQTWLTAAERIHTFTGTSDQFAGWLFGIARKHSGNTHRRGLRRNTQPTDPGDTEAFGQPATSGPEPTYSAQDWVVRALATLPPRERDVVGCRDVVGLDVESTAAALGISAVAVRVAHHRGLRRLRESVAAPAADQDGIRARSRSR